MTSDAISMGWHPLERVGAYTGVVWVSIRGFDERGVSALPAGLWRAGLRVSAATAAVLRLPHQWTVRGWPVGWA